MLVCWQSSILVVVLVWRVSALSAAWVAWLYFPHIADSICVSPIAVAGNAGVCVRVNQTLRGMLWHKVASMPERSFSGS